MEICHEMIRHEITERNAPGALRCGTPMDADAHPWYTLTAPANVNNTTLADATLGHDTRHTTRKYLYLHV